MFPSVQQNKTFLMSGLVGEESDDSMDSDDEDSDDASRPQSPTRGAGTSAGPGGRPSPKRERPDDMLDTFVQVKRANVPLSSLLTNSEQAAPLSGRASPTSTDCPANGAAEGVQSLCISGRASLISPVFRFRIGTKLPLLCLRGTEVHRPSLKKKGTVAGPKSL